MQGGRQTDGISLSSVSPLRSGRRSDWDSPVAVRRLLQMDPAYSQSASGSLPQATQRSVSASPMFPPPPPPPPPGAGGRLSPSPLREGFRRGSVVPVLETRVEEAADSLRAALGKAQRVIAARGVPQNSAIRSHTALPLPVNAEAAEARIRSSLKQRWGVESDPIEEPHPSHRSTPQPPRENVRQRNDDLKRELEVLASRVEKEEEGLVEMGVRKRRAGSPFTPKGKEITTLRDALQKSISEGAEGAQRIESLEGELLSMKRICRDIGRAYETIVSSPCLSISTAAIMPKSVSKEKAPNNQNLATALLETHAQMEDTVKQLTLQNASLSHQLQLGAAKASTMQRALEEAEEERDYLLVEQSGEGPTATTTTTTSATNLNTSPRKVTTLEALLQKEKILREDRETELERAKETILRLKVLEQMGGTAEDDATQASETSNTNNNNNTNPSTGIAAQSSITQIQRIITALQHSLADASLPSKSTDLVTLREQLHQVQQRIESASEDGSVQHDGRSAEIEALRAELGSANQRLEAEREATRIAKAAPQQLYRDQVAEVNLLREELYDTREALHRLQEKENLDASVSLAAPLQQTPLVSREQFVQRKEAGVSEGLQPPTPLQGTARTLLQGVEVEVKGAPSPLVAQTATLQQEVLQAEQSPLRTLQTTLQQGVEVGAEVKPTLLPQTTSVEALKPTLTEPTRRPELLVHQDRLSVQNVGGGEEGESYAAVVQCLHDALAAAERTAVEAEKRAAESEVRRGEAEARALQADAIAEDALNTTTTDTTAQHNALTERIRTLETALAQTAPDKAAHDAHHEALLAEIAKLEDLLSQEQSRGKGAVLELEAKTEQLLEGENRLLKALSAGARLERELEELRASQGGEGGADAESLAAERQQVGALQSTLSFREAELDAAQALNEELSAERDKLQTLLTTATERAGDSLRRASIVEAELGRQKSVQKEAPGTPVALAHMKQHRDEKQAEIQLLREEMSAERERTRGIEAEYNQLKGSVQGFEREIADLKDDATASKDAQQEAALAAERTLQSMAEKSEAMEALATKAIKEAKTVREATNGDMYAKVMQLTKENERLQAELDAIMAQLANSHLEVEQSNHRLQGMSAEHVTQQQQINNVVQRMVDMKDDSRGVCDELTQANQDLRDSQEANASLQDQCNRLTSQLETALLGGHRSLSSPHRSHALEDEVEALRKANNVLSAEVQMLQAEKRTQPHDREQMKIEAQQMAGRLADMAGMLEGSGAALAEETQRNERLEARIQMCLVQLKRAEQDRLGMEQDGGEEIGRLQEEKGVLVQQVQHLTEHRNSVEKDKRDIMLKLEQFGWLVGQRGALVRELFKLNKAIEAVVKSREMSPSCKRLADAAKQQSVHVLNTFLSEVERQHLGLAVIVHPAPEPQNVSPRALLRLLEHSPLTQHSAPTSVPHRSVTPQRRPPSGLPTAPSMVAAATAVPHTPMTL